jgi:hypothetical protein
VTSAVTSDPLNQYLTLDPSRRGEVFRAFRSKIEAMTGDGQAAEALAALRRAVSVDSGYSALRSLYRLVSKARAAQEGKTLAAQPRLAVPGSDTTQQLTWLLDLFLFGAGMDAQIYEAEYGVLRQEVYNLDSPLYRFQPQMVMLLSNYRDVARFPEVGATAETVVEMARAELESWKQLWGMLYERLGCQIIQNTFATPAWNTLGHLESRVPFSLGSYLRRLNQGMLDEAPSYVALHDIERLSAIHGKREWADDRFYFDAKLPCAPEYLPALAHSLDSLALAIAGKSKKCLVLDLDNTLWGGVIGDDGLGGIALGQGDPLGEAFVAFQHYVKRLKERGLSWRSAPRMMKPTPVSLSRSTRKWCCASATSPPSSPTGMTKPTTCAALPRRLTSGLTLWCSLTTTRRNGELYGAFCRKWESQSCRKTGRVHHGFRPEPLL